MPRVAIARFIGCQNNKKVIVLQNPRQVLSLLQQIN